MLKWLRDRVGRGDAAPGPTLERARALRREGDDAAATAMAQALLRERADDAGAMALLAALAADERRVEEGQGWARRALEIDPRCVDAHFAQGRLHETAERPDLAEASYRRVVALDPGRASGHTNLGSVLHRQNRFEEAAKSYVRALELEPGQPEALRNFALVAGTPEHLRQALAGFTRHLESHPRDAAAQAQYGHLCMHLGRQDEALEAYGRALALEPDNAEVHYARAQLLLVMGRYEEGWHEYQWRWRMEMLNHAMVRFAEPAWEGQPLEGALLLHGEPAFGDTLHFIRYAALAAPRCTRVIVECQPGLVRLLSGVAGVAEVVPFGQPLPPFAAHLPMVCAPLLFGTTLDAIPWQGPYLPVQPALAEHWRSIVEATSPRPRKVGLVWSGDPSNHINRERSVTLEQLAPLAEAQDVTFFSLQKGPAAAQRPPAGMHFVDLTGQLGDFADTAALVSQLDIVLSVDTAVAHLAGGVGVPTWVLVSYAPGWRWHLDREDNPWYPPMRLFRQPEPGDWSTPIEEIARALKAGS